MSTLQLDWVPSQGAVRFTVYDVLDDDRTTVKRVNPGGTLTAIRGYPDGTWHALSGLGYDYEAPMSVYVRYAICDRDAKNLTAPAPPNLLTAGVNGTFEGNITGWSDGGAVYPATVAYSTVRAHGGTGSMLVTWPNDPTGGGSVAIAQVAGLTVGQVYTVEAWVYVPAASIAPSAGIVLFGVGDSSAVVPVSTPDVWTRLTRTFTASAATAFVGVYNVGGPSTAGMSCSVDDVRVFGAGSEMVTATIFTQTPGRTNGEAWLRDVLQPILSRPVSVVSTGEEIYAARQTVLDVAGKRTPYVVWDSRQARQGTVTLVTKNTVVPTVYSDSTERDKLEALFSTGRPLLLSMCANKGFRNAYLAIDSVSFTRVGNGPTWLIDMAYFEVDNPTGLGVNIVPEVTYAIAQQLPPGATYQDWAGTGVGDGIRYFDVATRSTLP